MAAMEVIALAKGTKENSFWLMSVCYKKDLGRLHSVGAREVAFGRELVISMSFRCTCTVSSRP